MARSLSRREKTLVVAAAAATALFLLFRMMLVPVIRSESAAPRLVEEKLAVLKVYQGVVARKSLLEQEQRDLEEALQLYRPFLLPSDTPPLAAAALETRLKSLAGRAGLKIVRQNILDHRTRDHFLEIPVKIIATGTVDNVRDFIVMLESDSVFIDVQQVDLRSTPRRQPRGGAPQGAGHDVQATMTVAGIIPS